MGKAVIDLPDPLEQLAGPDQSSRAGAPPSVDDLLAQMAGEEIDRLLADADDPRDKSAAPAVTSNLPDSMGMTDATPFAVITGEKFIPTPAVAPGTRILAESPPAAEAPAAKSDRPSPVAPSAAALDDDLATSAAERTALEFALDDDGDSTTSAATSPNSIALEFPDIDPQSDAPLDGLLPFYLKPLEWLNAPLDAFPESVRGLVGKVALLTLFNASAVLIYVLVFRKHR